LLWNQFNGDYGQALAYFAEQLNPKTPELPKLPERTFDGFYKKEWAQYVSDNWKASTQTTLGSLATKHILPFFQSKNLGAIVPTDIVDFHRSMMDKRHHGKPYSRKTRRNANAVIVCIFNLAVDLRPHRTLSGSAAERSQAGEDREASIV
jgi:hypothetical protein